MQSNNKLAGGKTLESESNQPEKKRNPDIGKDDRDTSSSSWPSSPFRPINLLRYATSNSFRLIGWDDEDFRVLLEEHRKRRRAADLSIPDIEKDGEGSDSDSDRNIFNYINMREFKLYQSILSNLRYQRDAYIMGTDHANMRKEQREREEEIKKQKQEEAARARRAREANPFLSEMDDFFDTEIETGQSRNGNGNGIGVGDGNVPMTYRDYLALHPTVVDPSSLGNQQLNGIISWFIPSPTMYDSVLPTVLWTIAPPSSLQPGGGPLRRQINRSVCDLIPMSQNLLNDVMQRNIVWVLTDSSWRESVKGSSRNYFNITGGNQNSDAGLNTSSRVVTTKTARSHSYQGD